MNIYEYIREEAVGEAPALALGLLCVGSMRREVLIMASHGIPPFYQLRVCPLEIGLSDVWSQRSIGILLTGRLRMG